MNFIDSSAQTISKFIRKNYSDAASEKILFYSLSLIINTGLAIASTLIICAFTGHFLKSLILILLYTTLRNLSGGAHFASSLNCCIFSILIFTLSTHVSFPFSYLLIGQFMTIISALILFKTAPQGIRGISKIDPKYYPLLKYSSITLVLLNLYFQSSMLAVAFLIQAIQTTSFCEKLFILWERR